MASYRKLLPFESGTLAGHLLRLVPADRQSRFAGALADEVVRRHTRSLDWSRTTIIGFFEDGTLRGAAELTLDGSMPGASAEFAVTVEAPWQDSGIGSELLRRTIVLARNRGVRRLWMLCLAENARMRRIAIKHRGRLAFDEGLTWADVATPTADPGSLAAEWFGDALGWASSWRERVRAPDPLHRRADDLGLADHARRRVNP